MRESPEHILLRLTTGGNGLIDKRIKPAFRLPKKSGFIDSTLFWFWVDVVRKEYRNVKRGPYQYRVRTHKQIIDIWYDGGQEKFSWTEVFLTNFDRTTGILHCHICGTDAYLGLKPGQKWHDIAFGYVGYKNGKYNRFIAMPMKAAAYFNIWRLTRGHFAEFTDKATSEIDTQLSFVHGRSRIHREWSFCKESLQTNEQPQAIS